MTQSLSLTYLLILVGLLGLASVLVLRQVLRTRGTEMMLRDLQRKVSDRKGSSADYYELASILLKKKLYGQAISQLQKALKAKDLEIGGPSALIYNALGYAYASQEQYDLAIRNYKDALEQVPDYVTALNNLGFAYERKQLTAQALEVYERSLQLDQSNKTAQKRAETLRKIVMS